jgi:hypothetical protein
VEDRLHESVAILAAEVVLVAATLLFEGMKQSAELNANWLILHSSLANIASDFLKSDNAIGF